MSLKTQLIPSCLLTVALAFSSVTASAIMVLPQLESTGEDGIFNINTSYNLLPDDDSIFNFTSFTAGANSVIDLYADVPVYLYASEYIELNGIFNVFAPEVYFISSGFMLSGELYIQADAELYLLADSASLSAVNGLEIIADGTTIIRNDTSGNLTLSSIGEIRLESGGLLDQGDLVLTTPLPGALWLMISGMAIMPGMVSRQK